MGIELITILLFTSLLLLLAIGVPVGFALGSLSVIFTVLLWGPAGLGNIPLVIFRQASPVLLALPLFLLMASVLERSGIADALYEAIYRWTDFLAGGLAMGTVLICTIFAAMSGVSGAATVSMGLIAIPSMLKRGYDKHLATGSVAAGGVLGIVIPPSVIMIIYASITRVSVGRMFFGGIVPGVLIACMHMAYIGVKCARNPTLGPPIPPEERVSLAKKYPLLSP
jgi:tripartite ATP-independent transporter DctM subunit